MKTKKCLFGALSLGLVAGILRLVQYFTVIDKDGFFTQGALADFTNGCLVGILAVGVIFSFICSLKQKEQVPFARLYPRGFADLLFLALAVIAATEGAYRLFIAANATPIDSLSILLGILGLLSGLAWIFLCKRKETPLAFFPVLHLGGFIISYFWVTYQYIHVSGYVMMILGLCALLIFITSLMKAATGASCSRGRLTFVSALAICSIPATFAEAIFNPTFVNLLMLANGALIFALAILTLLCLSKPLPEEAAAEEENEGPDLTTMNQFFSELPEEEETEEEQTNEQND